MNKLKKATVLIMAILMATTTLTACNNIEKNVESSSDPKSAVTKGDGDPFGKYAEPVTIKIGQSVHPSTVFPSGETPEDNRFTRILKEKLNIEVEIMWQVGSTNDYNQKLNLAIASNDLPDAAVVDKTQFRTMAKSKQIADMTGPVTTYASDAMNAFFETTNGEAKKSATYDGVLQAMPGVQADADGYHMMWIRKDWLDKLNMEVPMSVEAIESTAKAFVDNNMGGKGKTIGIAAPHSGGDMYATFLNSNNSVYGFDPIFSAYNSYPGYWLEDGKGGATYGSIEPQTKEVLIKLNEMYAAGLIDKEMCVRKESAEPIIAGNTGIFFAPWWMGFSPIPDSIRTSPDANWQAYAAPLNKDGEWAPHVSDTTSLYTVVRKGFEHPEAIVKMANLLIQEEPNLTSGDLGIEIFPLRNMQSTTDEVQVTTDILRKYLKGEVTQDEIDKLSKTYVSIGTDVASAKLAKLEPYDNMDIKYWNPNVEDGSFGRLYSMLVGAAPIIDSNPKKVKSITYSQTDKMLTRWSNLKKMEDETFLKIVTGASPIESFDKFVVDWKRQGGDDILTEVVGLLK